MNIQRNGSQPSTRGPSEYFTGTVRVDPLIQAPARVFGSETLVDRILIGCLTKDIYAIDLSMRFSS